MEHFSIQSNTQANKITPDSFCWCVVGSPGSGKTSFIQQLLSSVNLYKDKFEYIIIVSPSPIIIANVDPECITQQFSVQWIYDRLNFIQSLQQKDKNILIILDDCVSEIKKNQNDVQLQQLFCNRRHIISKCTISILVTTQQLMMLPSKFRSLCDPFTFLSVSPRDLDQIKRELVYKQNHNHLISILNQMSNERHSFIYVRQRPSLLCLNFKPVVEGSRYISQSNAFQSTQSSKLSQIQEPQQKRQQRSRSRSPSCRQPPDSDRSCPIDQRSTKLFSFKQR